MNTSEYEERKTLVHLVRSGQSIATASKTVGRSRSWGHKWWLRFQARQEWGDLCDRSRAPRQHPRQLPSTVRQAIRQVRSELEAEAQQAAYLGYVGAPAVQARLRERKVLPIPSLSSIERELRAAGMVKARPKSAQDPVTYPQLHPTQAHQLIQADILPKYLSGGAAIACFNAIDVVSRYPSGEQSATRTAQNACDFLWHVWQEEGIPVYQQVDNEGCFSGGHTHPGVLGKVLRLALLVGTQLVFSPFYHPASNAFVERFHQDYAQFVWQKAVLDGLPAVRQRSALFYHQYRASRHHSQLQGRSPAECHRAVSARPLPLNCQRPERLPLTAGQVHFMREVDAKQQVRVLNLDWKVPTAKPHQGVWVTLTLTPRGATLAVFDAAPDAPRRTRLIAYPFPLKELVVPLAKTFCPPTRRWTAWFGLPRRALGYVLYRLSTMS